MGLAEVDGVENLDAVALPLQEASALYHHAPLGVSHDIGTVALHQVGLDEKAGLAAAASAHNQHVFVPCRLRVPGAVVHGQPLRLRQDHVFLKHRVDIGRDVLARAPPGRAVFTVLSVFAGVFALEVNCGSQQGCRDRPGQEVKGMEAWNGRRESSLQRSRQVEQRLCRVRVFGHPPRLSQAGGSQRDEQVGKQANYRLFKFLVHRSSPLCALGRVRVLVSRRRSRRVFRRSSRRALRAVYSSNAAVSASASFALKNTR